MADPPKDAPAPASRLVPVFTPGLGVRMVEASEAPAALQGGARFASESEYHEAKLDARYGGPTGAAAAAGYGAVRGLGSMFGVPTDAMMLSGASTDPTRYKSDDPFRGKITETEGDRWREKLGAYQDLHPYASFGGEAAGIAGATVLGGGVVGGAGAAAEGVLGRGILGTLGRGAAEGAIYSAGKEANDLAIRNEELTAEKVLAAAGHGALFGAATNAGASALGHGVSSLRGAGEEGVGGLRPPRSASSPAEAGSFREGIGEMLQKGADVKTIKALGGSTGDIQALERTVRGGFRKVAQDIQGDIEGATGKRIGFHNRESLNEYANSRLGEMNAERVEIIADLDKNKVGIAPNTSRFSDTVKRDVLGPAMVRDANGVMIPAPAAEGVVAAVSKFVNQVEAASAGKAPTFTDWNRWRISLDKQITHEAINQTPAMAALKEVRTIMEKEFEASAEKAAQQMGTTFVDRYQSIKSLTQSLIKAKELTERGVAKELATNSLGMRATMAGLSGLASGNPLTGLAMGLAGKVVQDRGDMLAADLLSRAANVMGVQRLAARTNARMATGVAGLLGSKSAAAGLAAPADAGGGFFSELLKDASLGSTRIGVAGATKSRSEFDRRAEAIAALQANPAALSAKVGTMLGPVANASTKLVAAATNKAMGGLTFLADKMPPSRQDPFSLQPQFQAVSRASDSEVAKHARYLEALDNPTIVLTEARKGTLTRDHVDAVKANYPKLYDEMRDQVMRGLVDSKSELPYGRRIQLGILLDIPTDKTLSPEFLTAIQATYSSAEKAGAESPPPTLARPLNIASGLSTGTQSAIAEGLEK